MNPITISGTAPSPQPSSVKELPVQKRTTNEAIDGSLSVSGFGVKYQVTMSWIMAPSSLFQQIKSWGDGFATVHYKNTNSNVSGGTLEFDGILEYAPDAFLRGSDSLAPLTVTIRQV